MNTSEKQSFSFVLIGLILISLAVVGIEIISIYDYSIIKQYPKEYIAIASKLLGHMEIARGGYVLYFALFLYINMKATNSISTSSLLINLVLTLACGAAFVMVSDFYTKELIAKNLYFAINGLSFLGLFFTTPTVVSSFQTADLKEDDDVFGLNKNVRDEWSLFLRTTKGFLAISNPFRGIFVVGGPGAGKSASIVEPLIIQTIWKGYTAFIYDFKGSPEPELSKTAYSALKYLENNNYTFEDVVGVTLPGLGSNISTKQVKYKHVLPTFFHVNFSQIEYSHRINPLAPKYIKSSTDALNVAKVIAFSLEKKWIKDTDFWANNAISIFHATTWHLVKNYPQYATLPHVITMITSDMKRFVPWLQEDHEVGRLMKPTIEAIEQSAQGQIAGALASIQLPLTKLLNPEFFWILSEDETPLDPNDPENPSIVTVANDSAKRSAISPGVSLIASIVAARINQKNRRPCLFAIDELPTLYIADLDVLPATGRSNKVITMLAMQTRSQLDEKVGKDLGDVISGTMGNQFIGAIDDYRQAEDVSKMLGDSYKTKNSRSDGDSGSSKSQTLEKRQVMAARDIMGQPTGQFVCKIADGRPAYAKPQFNMHEIPTEDIPRKYETATLIALMDANYKSIFNDCEALLSKYDYLKEEA